MHPDSVKKQVRRLRKQGCSIITLSRKFKIAKSTVSLWVRDIELPIELRKYLTDNSTKGAIKGSQILKAKREIEQNRRIKEAQKILCTIDMKNQKIARFIAAILFWCEGSKRLLSSVRITNSDPELIKLFLKCLRTGYEIDETKFRALMHLHSYHSEKDQLKFWSKITSIPPERFNKSYHKKNTEIRKRKNYPGCVLITYFDSKVARSLDAIYHSITSI